MNESASIWAEHGADMATHEFAGMLALARATLRTFSWFAAARVDDATDFCSRKTGLRAHSSTAIFSDV